MQRAEVGARGKKEFLQSPPARDAKSPLCGVRIHMEEERTNRTERISEQKFIFHSETGGLVLIPFFGMCQSVRKAAEAWAGAGPWKKKEHIGPLGQKRHRSRWGYAKS